MSEYDHEQDSSWDPDSLSGYAYSDYSCPASPSANNLFVPTGRCLLECMSLEIHRLVLQHVSAGHSPPPPSLLTPRPALSHRSPRRTPRLDRTLPALHPRALPMHRPQPQNPRPSGTENPPYARHPRHPRRASVAAHTQRARNRDPAQNACAAARNPRRHDIE